MLAADVLQLLQMVVDSEVGAETLDRLIVAILRAEAALSVMPRQLVQLGNEGVVNAFCGHIEKSPCNRSCVQTGALHPLAGSAVSGASPQKGQPAAGGKPWCCVLFAVCPYVCLSLLVPGQYAAVWRSLTSARVSNRGHHAAELGCGRLRRYPVICPATDRGMRDTPYDRCRTLTAAYRAGACLSLNDFPAVSSQRLFSKLLFLDLRRIDFGALSFPTVSRRWQVPRKKVSKNAGRILLPFRLHTILPAFAVLFNFDGHPFSGRRILTYFGFLIRAKSC